MLGKILGGIAGKQFADDTAGVSGPTGMLAGAVIGSVLRRASIPGIIAITAGGYALKKYKEKKDREATTRTSSTPNPGATAPAT